METEYLEREPGQEFDLMEYWRIIVKRKGILFVFAGTIILLVGIYSFTAAPKYQPGATLLIGEEASKVLSVEDQFGFLDYQSQLKEQIYMNTQLQLLQSSRLAERVARKLDLVSRVEFGVGEYNKKSIVGKIKDLVTFKWLRSEKEANPRDPTEEVVEVLQKNLDVSQVRDTKVLRVSYTMKHPRLATDIVNTFADEFIQFSIDTRYETTQQASDFLSEQIAQLREDLDAKERELQRYSTEKDILVTSNEESIALNKFEELENALTQAQIKRVRVQDNYNALRNSTADTLPRTIENRLIQDLEEEYSRMKNQYRELSKEYKAEHPTMLGLASKIDSMREEIQNEISNAVELARTEYREAWSNERNLQAMQDKQREEVARINTSAIHYRSIKIEVENMQERLDALHGMQTQTQVSARLGGLKTSNITVIDKAKVPKDPVSPKKKLNLVLALLMGIFGGVGLCFMFEYLDNSVKGPEDVERLSGLPSLGVIPFLSPEGKARKKRSVYPKGYKQAYSYGEENAGEDEDHPDVKEIDLINLLHPKYPIAEDYRTIRTSIMLSHPDGPPDNIAITSAMPAEGKTATLVNLAVSFAQLGKRVLIVDADLRKPRLEKLFRLRNIKGLSGFLTGKASVEEVILKTDALNICVLPSGLIPPNPAELLDSKKMKVLVEALRKGFDIVLFDTPPVLSVVDAQVISSLVGSVILVVQPEKTTKKPFLRAVEILGRANAKILGVVFNQAKIRKGQYYMDYYSYYRRDYFSKDESD